MSYPRMLVLALLIVLGNVRTLAQDVPSPVSAEPGDAVLTLSPEAIVAAPGETVGLDVVLDRGGGTVGVSAASLEIMVDPAILRVVSLEAVSPLLPTQEYVLPEEGATAALVIGARSCQDAQRVPTRLTIARLTVQALGRDGSQSPVRWREAVALSPVACGISDLQTQDWRGISQNIISSARGATVCVSGTGAPCPARPAAPQLVLAPDTGARGARVAARVSGFRVGEHVTITWDRGKPKQRQQHDRGRKGGPEPHRDHAQAGKKLGNRLVTVGTTTADANGEASVIFTVRRDATAGHHAVTATGTAGSRATATFRVRGKHG